MIFTLAIIDVRELLIKSLLFIVLDKNVQVLIGVSLVHMPFYIINSETTHVQFTQTQAPLIKLVGS